MVFLRNYLLLYNRYIVNLCFFMWLINIPTKGNDNRLLLHFFICIDNIDFFLDLYEVKMTYL